MRQDDPLGVVELLDPYVGLATEEARLEAIATISAGGRGVSREGREIPTRSADGAIVLHDRAGRAPGLAAALAATEGKRLTIAFPWDDRQLFIRGRFVRYSATRLEVYGDELALTVIRPDGSRETHVRGAEDYARLVQTCRAAYSIYFVLARWRGDEPELYFPDGYGYYRLRTASRHSIRSLVGTLEATRRATGGRIAGIPFELSLDYREVTDATGARREIPVWVIVTRGPGELALPAAAYRRIILAGLRQGEQLLLTPPSEEATAADFEEPLEEEIDEPTAARLQAGGRCDAAAYRRAYFAAATGTPLASDDGRAAWLGDYTGGRFTSLAAFLAEATDVEAARFIEATKHRARALQSAPAVDVAAEEGEDAAGVAAPTGAARSASTETARPATTGTSDWLQHRIADYLAEQPTRRRVAPLPEREWVRQQLSDGLRAAGYRGRQQPIEALRFLIGRELATWDDLMEAEVAGLRRLVELTSWPERLVHTARHLGFAPDTDAT